MPVFIASDLQGQHLKSYVKKMLEDNKCEVFDMGFVGESNYSKVADIINSNPEWLAIVFCENANCFNLLFNSGRYTNIRSVLALPDGQFDMWTAKNKHGANVLCFSSSCSKLYPYVTGIVSNFIAI